MARHDLKQHSALSSRIFNDAHYESLTLFLSFSCLSAIQINSTDAVPIVSASLDTAVTGQGSVIIAWESVYRSAAAPTRCITSRPAAVGVQLLQRKAVSK